MAFLISNLNPHIDFKMKTPNVLSCRPVLWTKFHRHYSNKPDWFDPLSQDFKTKINPRGHLRQCSSNYYPPSHLSLKVFFFLIKCNYLAVCRRENVYFFIYNGATDLSLCFFTLSITYLHCATSHGWTVWKLYLVYILRLRLVSLSPWPKRLSYRRLLTILWDSENFGNPWIHK